MRSIKFTVARLSSFSSIDDAYNDGKVEFEVRAIFVLCLDVGCTEQNNML